MPSGVPPPNDDPDGDPPPDAWDDDAWARDDWKRDRWKEADWGKPALPAGEWKPGKQKRGGLAAWNAQMVEAGPYLSLGLQSAFAMAFFVGLGYLVDRGLGTRPWGLIAGAVLGMVGVITLLVRLSNRANAEAAARRAGEGRRPE